MKRSENYTINRGGECSPVERLAHCLRVDFTCPYCGIDLKKAKSIHIDHIVAQVWGGSKGEHNQIACCGSCNCSKKHKLLAEFAAGRADAEMVRRVRKIQRRRLPIEQARAILGSDAKNDKVKVERKARAQKMAKKQGKGKNQKQQANSSPGVGDG